jgi:hypothetical protein
MAVDMSEVVVASYTHPHLNLNLPVNPPTRPPLPTALLPFMGHIQSSQGKSGAGTKAKHLSVLSFPTKPPMGRGTHPSRKNSRVPLPTLKSDAERESGPVGRTNL